MFRQTQSTFQSAQSHPEPVFYTFMFSTPLSMTAIGVSSEGGKFVARNSADVGNSDWIYPEQEVTRILVDSFRSVPQVKSICATFGPHDITIWTLLDGYDREAREKVYGKELEICRTLGIYDFEFRATSIDLICPEELVGTGSHEIYKRR